MPHVDLPGVTLSFSDLHGTGAPVVFLHARSGTSESWEPNLPAFASAGYRCITYDRRGVGQSQRSDVSEQPGYAIDDLHALIQHLDLPPVHLVGTAAGGVVALEYAIAYPDQIRSLVIADSIGGLQNDEISEVQKRMRPRPLQVLPVELRELSAGYRGTNPEGTRKWVEIAATVHFDDADSWPAQLRRHHPTAADLQRFTAPTLIVVGEADLLSPPAMMRMFARHFPNRELVTIPEAGHAAHWEQPDTWNRLVLEFMSRH
jgi:pimeloyl-ACP methyl ester carboxylesterase